jgi:hypothetical protein
VFFSAQTVAKIPSGYGKANAHTLRLNRNTWRGIMITERALLTLLCCATALTLSVVVPASAKDIVKIAFIGPLTGGNSAPG